MAKYHDSVVVVIEVDAPNKRAAEKAILQAKQDLRAAMPASVGPWGITSHGVLIEGAYDPLGPLGTLASR